MKTMRLTKMQHYWPSYNLHLCIIGPCCLYSCHFNFIFTIIVEPFSFYSLTESSSSNNNLTDVQSVVHLGTRSIIWNICSWYVIKIENVQNFNKFFKKGNNLMLEI